MEDPIKQSHVRLRLYLGILGILLPIIIVVGDSIDKHSFLVQCSISHYYYTIMRNIFVGFLWAFGLFLVTYPGYKKENAKISDDWLTNISGILAIIVSLVPTICSRCIFCDVTDGHSNSLYNHIHLVSAGLFLILMGYMSYFRFTQSDKKKDTWENGKLQRNNIYRICAYFIWGSILVLILNFAFNIISDEAFPQFVYTCEVVALWAFGFAWMVKGKALDKIMKWE